MKYPLKANVFLTVLAVSAVFTGYGIVEVFGFFRLDFLNISVWCIAGIISESSAVYLSRGNIFASTTEAVFVLSFLISGPPAALVVISVASLFWVGKKEDGYTHVFNIPIRYTLFNISHFIVILGVVTVFYRFIGGFFYGGIPLIPALIVSPLFFVLSCILNSLFYKLEEDTGFFSYLLSTFSRYLPGALMVSLSGIMIAYAYSRFDILSILLFIVPVLLTRQTFTNLSELSN
jgi:hypothetical protein